MLYQIQPSSQLLVSQDTKIKVVHNQLNNNAASIHNHLGNGRLGLLVLTVQPVVYNTLSHLPFVPPVNPGPTVVYPINPIQHKIIAANKLYEMNTRLFKQYDTCGCIIKQLLLGCFITTFVSAMSNLHIEYANLTTMQLITHLYDTYGHIIDRNFKKNK